MVQKKPCRYGGNWTLGLGIVIKQASNGWGFKWVSPVFFFPTRRNLPETVEVSKQKVRRYFFSPIKKTLSLRYPRAVMKVCRRPEAPKCPTENPFLPLRPVWLHGKKIRYNIGVPVF